MAAGEMVLSLVSPEGVLFSGSFESLSIPAWDGLRGILRGHAPLVGKLGTGIMSVKGGNGTERFGVYGGFYQVSPGRVDVIVDRADVSSRLDPESCMRDFEAAMKPRRREFDKFEEDEAVRKIAKIRLLLSTRPQA